jgi:hypothetical protein
MLPAEVVDVDEQHDPVLGGYRVELHDGTRAVVHDDGTVTLHVNGLGDRLSPAARALSPGVRFADLSTTFADLVDQVADATATFVELLREVGDPGSEDQGDGEPPVEPVVEPVEPPAPVDPAEVPTGSAEAVLAWVGDDQDRALAALAAEGERDKGPRAGLSRDLAAILTPAGGGDE